MKHSGRKGGVLLLVLALLWPVLPSAICQLSGDSMSALACCRAMALDCPMHGADMSGSCCTVQPDQSLAVPDNSVLAKSGLALAFPPHQVESVMPVMVADPGWYATESSPPEISPGLGSILRI
jgi:hypothetical protein